MGIKKLFNFANLSVAKKIYVLIALAIIPIVCSNFCILAYIYQNGEHGNIEMLKELTNSVAKNLDDSIDEKKSKVKEISKNQQIMELLNTPNNSALKSSVMIILNEIQKYISYKNSEDSLFVINNQGECLTFCDVLSRNIKDIKNYQAFKESMKGNTYVLPFLNQKKQFQIFIFQPIQLKNHKIYGVLLLQLDDKYITKHFLRLLDGVPESKGLLIDNDNAMFSLSKYNEKFLSTKIPLFINKKNNSIRLLNNFSIDMNQLLTQQDFIKKVIRRESKTFEKKINHRIYVSTILPKQHWIIGVNVPEFEIFRDLLNLIRINVVIVIIVSSITIALALFLGDTISKPIHVLIKTAQAIDRGDFEQVTKIANYMKTRENDTSTVKIENLTKLDSNILINNSNRQDDLGQLIRVFMQMASHVKEREQNLEKQVKKLNIQLEIDNQKRIKDVNTLTENENFENLKLTVSVLKQNRDKS